MDDLTSLFLKKVTELEKFVKQNKNDRSSIIGEIFKIQKWLAGDRSIQQHRCCQAFLTFLYMSYGDQYENRAYFVAHVKCKLGFAKVKITKTTIEGERVTFKKFMPYSLSFPECSQKKHNEFFNKLQEYALSTWGVNFAEWHESWAGSPNLVQ